MLLAMHLWKKASSFQNLDRVNENNLKQEKQMLKPLPLQYFCYWIFYALSESLYTITSCSIRVKH